MSLKCEVCNKDADKLIEDSRNNRWACDECITTISVRELAKLWKYTRDLEERVSKLEPASD